MRIFHTSDWHLGHSLRGFDRQFEHQCFLDWLLGQIREQDIDALLVTGDIFDNANPSSASQKQLYRFLQAARETAPHLRVVMIAGNHDSPSRLEAPSPLLDLFDTRVVGQTLRKQDGSVDTASLIVPLHDRNGVLRAWCLAVPFLRPGDVPRVETDGDAYLAGVEALYQQALQEVLSKRQAGEAIVALGHCHLDGGAVSLESERRIVVGGLESLSVAIFDRHIAYAALGHLHLPQSVGGRDWVRYSGSPLPMSFSEIDYPHQVVCVELEGEQLKSIQSHYVPRIVDLLRIPAKPAPLPDVLETLAALPFAEPALSEERWPYLEVRVLFDAPEPGARSAIESVLAGKPVRLAGIDVSYQRGNDPASTTADLGLGDLSHLQPEDVLKRHYQSQYGTAVPTELLQVFQELLLETETPS
ncbi:exonuclease SbcCD subunit D C-terminal domain-containing protein [Methylomicrobium sp. Wu6]|uniref:exonuclease SbcCD subunit D n=1 Tax=Methylomicrobium sp. Wu6 TaxID=3107928 RepID=UPI002DD6B526|nr:exonuclease SbcCD subunit D C-terminal domain-containing protein [Methylomicrobium sp. Wu6]MEC4746987.1 exonuclease SbcCD subunit D C-terminal domain-containing protein [Methylomicrobium sp. Wu6]